MSEESKKQMGDLKRTFEKIQEGTQELSKEAGKIDRGLQQKIEKVTKEAGEVVKHIEERQKWNEQCSYRTLGGYRKPRIQEQ